MDSRPDLTSILPFLPVILRSSSLFWPPPAVDSLKALSLGPDVSRVDSGNLLFDAVLDLRASLALPEDCLAFGADEGFRLFFDELMDRVDARAWFGEVVPLMARLLLRLPAMLEEHYRGADGVLDGRIVGLRVLKQQEAGIVFLSQELIAALLACALFCLFPTRGRYRSCLPSINFDHLFAALHPDWRESQEQKIKCLIHYLERITSDKPVGFVSFERKILPLEKGSSCVSYPEEGFWQKSVVSLCPLEVCSRGLIEDQKHEALEIDFANELLGGGALSRGCVQEEIRFMINPELIVGMLFMPSMQDNEAIEIVGAERFSNYAGYASSFRFVGDYRDEKPSDTYGRRKTRIVAIDALYSPGMRQYGVKCLLRETNKAFCGFFDEAEYSYHLKNCQENALCKTRSSQVPGNSRMKPKFGSCSSSEEHKGTLNASEIKNLQNGPCQVSSASCQNRIGVATGNWGCGAFGGDLELKCIIQWLAASQALKPFILYYTFGEEALQRLEEVVKWILMHKWTVGDLWSMLVEYSLLRLNGQTMLGFLNWLVPTLEYKTGTHADPME